jgi:hypothetical protein
VFGTASFLVSGGGGSSSNLGGSSVRRILSRCYSMVAVDLLFIIMSLYGKKE